MNPRQKKFVMVLVPASLFLVWRVISLFSTPSAPASAAAETPSQPPPALEVPVVQRPLQLEVSQAVFDLQARRAKLAWGRDPFAARVAPMPTSAPAVAPVRAPAPPAWLLTGVSHAGGKTLAILDGRIVAEGDRVADRYEIVEITDREVIVRDGNWAHTFSLGVKTAQTVALGEQK